VEVEDDTIASPDEVAIGENAEGAFVEEVANAAELDDVSEDNPAAEEDTEEDADDRCWIGEPHSRSAGRG